MLQQYRLKYKILLYIEIVLHLINCVSETLLVALPFIKKNKLFKSRNDRNQILPDNVFIDLLEFYGHSFKCFDISYRIQLKPYLHVQLQPK